MNHYAPFPVSMFQQLDRIRDLTRHDKVVTIDRLFSHDKTENFSGSDENMGVTETTIQDCDKQTPAKRMKCVMSIHELLESGDVKQQQITVEGLWTIYKDEDIEPLTLKSVEKLLNLCDDSECSWMVCQKYFPSSISSFKEQDLAAFLESYQNIEIKHGTKFIVLKELFKVDIIDVETLSTLTEPGDDGDFLSEEEEKTLLIIWLKQNDNINGDNKVLIESILKRNPDLYEDNQMMETLAHNLKSNLSQLKDKCPKFSKFLLQLVTKVGTGLSASVYSNLLNVVEENKTFLKKRMEQELGKKIP